jgi:hypothetical protein
LAFDALQQDDDEDDEDEDDEDDAMADDSAAPKVAVATNVFEMATETESSNPAVDEPAATDDTDEIT